MPFFATGEHQVDIAVTVGDEAFYTIENPCAVFFLGSFEHYALKVRTCIGLGEVHRHGLAFANAGDIFGSLLLVAELIESFGAVLQTHRFSKPVSARLTISAAMI